MLDCLRLLKLGVVFQNPRSCVPQEEMDSNDKRIGVALAALKKLKAAVKALPAISTACPNYPMEHKVTARKEWSIPL